MQRDHLNSLVSRNVGKAILLLAVLICSIVAVSFSLDSSTVVPSSGAVYYPPAPQVIFEDEFESGDYSAWTGVSTTTGDNASVTALNPYTDRYASQFQTDAIASGTKYAYCYKSLSSAFTDVYARAYFYIADGLPLDDNDDRFGLIGFEVGSQLQCTLRVRRSGGVDKFNIVGLNGTGSVSKDSDAVFPVEERWFCIEFFIRVHSTIGEYRAWINGVERITITNIDTTRHGDGVSHVRFGLTSTINVQHRVEVYCDSAVIATSYVGQVRYVFGIVGSVSDASAIKNFFWLFGNQSISYRCLSPSEVTNFADVDRFDGLVVWTKQVGSYNVTAIRQFAETHVVISDARDFCGVLYPSLSESMQVISASTVSYVIDWGNFRSSDLVEMRNMTGDVNQLRVVQATGLASFANITTIARYDASRIALFRMSGSVSGSGFYVMDLDATSAETEWTGIWHVFPAVKLVEDFPTGKYARWMANGQSWWDLAWVYSRIDAIAAGNSDIVVKKIIGRSVENRDIPALFIGTGSRYAIVDGSIHGDEKSTTFACLRVAELLVEYFRSDPYWQSRLSEYTVIVVPVLNPDGFVRNTRANANGKELNRQFPPVGTTTEPEAWALRHLMGNYTPTVYVNNHEGGHYYPLDMFYGAYETSTTRSKTVSAMRQANATFVGLAHWGWFTEVNSYVWIGKVKTIESGAGVDGMASNYASWAHGTSCMLTETFMASPTWNARKSLWALDYYPAVMIAFLRNIQR